MESRKIWVEGQIETLVTKERGHRQVWDESFRLFLFLRLCYAF